MSLTVAIPSIGRPSLARTIYSFIDQLEDGDQVILVADPKGDKSYVQFMHHIASARVGVDWVYAAAPSGDGGWGLPQRNRAYELATPGNYVWCLADDDIATPDALEVIRHSISAHCRWLICQAGRGTADPWVWQRPIIEVGNIDADCIVAPAGVTSRWGLGYTGDLEFAQALQEELGDPYWLGNVVAVAKPSAEYLEFVHYPALAGV